MSLGPIPRYLFNDNVNVVKNYLFSRENRLYGAVEQLSLNQISSLSNIGCLEYFMTPYIRPGVQIPSIGLGYTEAAKDYLNSLSEQLII